VIPTNHSAKRLLLILVAALLAGAIAGGAEPSSAPDVSTLSSASANKLALRNNAASLLDQLLSEEKGVHYVLLIKGHRAVLQQLIKKISATTAAAQEQLRALAKTDPSLNLRAIELPAGEKATRAAIQDTEEHELLFTSGADFEFTLLLAQANALGYGWHLAQIAADNSTSPAETKAFAALSASLQDLYQQTVALIRSPPPAK
jgi:hypothetical protein